MILADGPSTEPAAVERQAAPDSPAIADMVFTGDALSHNFPSVAQINIEVTILSDTTAKVALSSSDGAGALTNSAQGVGGGKWIISEPIYMGTGWGSKSDPFNQLDIQRSLIISSDGKTAIYQDMGADTSLALVGTDPTKEESCSGASFLKVGFALSLILIECASGFV